MSAIGRYYAQARQWIRTQYYERKFGVATTGFMDARALGIENPDSMDHSPLGYDYVFWALRTIPFPAREVVFLDYGSGKGRVLVAAASLPFRKVVGVEISASLAATARDNLAHMRHRRAREVAVYESDAAEFPLPDDVNVLLIFNPFVGQTLTDVVARIEASLNARPRDLFIIAVNHNPFEQRVRGAAWLRKVYEAPLCALYRATASIVLND